MSKKLNICEKVQLIIKKTKPNNFKCISILLTVFVILVWCYNLIPIEKETYASEYDENDAVFIGTFVGDIMFDRYIEKFTSNHDYSSLFSDVSSFFKESNYVTGNLENPVVENGLFEKADKKIHLKTNSKAVEALKEMNFNVVNLANNHIKDYGESGIKETIMALRSNSIDFVGAGLNLEDSSSILYTELDGIKIATLGFSDIVPQEFASSSSRSGVLSIDSKKYLPLVQEAKKKSNLVIVHIHWGTEYSNRQSESQEDISKELADAGADIIIGHHPHALQPIEIYKNSVIFYSLGNFIFDQPWSITKESALVQCIVDKDGKAKIEVNPIWINNGKPTIIVNTYREKKITKTLTRLLESSDYRVDKGKIIIELDKLKNLEGYDFNEE